MDDPERRNLHLAVGAYAEYLVGMIDRQEMQAAADAVPAAQKPDYEEIIAGLRRSMPEEA